MICKLSSDQDFINQINFNSIQLLSTPFSINHCLSFHAHAAKESDQNRLTTESYVASKALQAVACCVYTAHSLDLQAQQAHTHLPLDEHGRMLPVTSHVVPAVANTGLCPLSRHLRVYSRQAAPPVLSNTQTTSGTITEGKGSRLAAVGGSDWIEQCDIWHLETCYSRPALSMCRSTDRPSCSHRLHHIIQALAVDHDTWWLLESPPLNIDRVHYLPSWWQ